MGSRWHCLPQGAHILPEGTYFLPQVADILTNPPEEHGQGPDDGYADADGADGFGAHSLKSNTVLEVLRVVEALENSLEGDWGPVFLRISAKMAGINELEEVRFLEEFEMKINWAESQFDWSEILNVESPFRIVKIVYGLVRALVKTVVSRRSTEIVLQQIKPNGDKFHTRVVLRGVVFCTFLPNWISRHFPVRCVSILYTNGKDLDICVKGLFVNLRVGEFEEIEGVYNPNVDTP